MPGLSEELFGQILAFIESGGYALKAYDRFRRLTREQTPDRRPGQAAPGGCRIRASSSSTG